MGLGPEKNTIPGAPGQPVWKEDWWALHYTYDPDGEIPAFVSTLKTYKEYMEELEEARRRATEEAQRHQEEARQRARLQEEEEEDRDYNDVHVNWRFYLKGTMSDAEVEEVKDELATKMARYVVENDCIERGVELHGGLHLKRGFLVEEVMHVNNEVQRARRVYYFDDGDVSLRENDSVPVIEVRYHLVFQQTRDPSYRGIRPDPVYSARAFIDITQRWYDEMTYGDFKQAIAEMCGIGPIEISDRSRFTGPTIARTSRQAERFYDRATQRMERSYQNPYPFTMDFSPPLHLRFYAWDYLANRWERWHTIP